MFRLAIDKRSESFAIKWMFRRLSSNIAAWACYVAIYLLLVPIIKSGAGRQRIIIYHNTTKHVSNKRERESQEANLT